MILPVENHFFSLSLRERGGVRVLPP